MCVCMDYIFLLLLYIYHSTLLLSFLDYKRVAINITQSSTGVLSYLCRVQANLICRISAANWPLSVSTRAENCKLFWSAAICLFGGHVSWGWIFLKIWVFLGFQEFLPPCTFCRCLVCLQSSRHTSCYEHRHGLTQTCRRNDQICHRGGISQKHKSRLYCDVPQEKSDRCGCKWGDEVGMNDIPFTISLGGAHCGAGNREAGCKLFKLPVYRASLPDTLPHTPCLTYWITKFIEMLFSKETWSKHEI